MVYLYECEPTGRKCHQAGNLNIQSQSRGRHTALFLFNVTLERFHNFLLHFVLTNDTAKSQIYAIPTLLMNIILATINMLFIAHRQRNIAMKVSDQGVNE